MKDRQCVEFLQWALPRLQMRWPGFRKVRRQVCKRIDRRLTELQLPDVIAYRHWLESHPEEWAILDSFCRISISRFYRDRGVFDCLRREILPSLATVAMKQGESVVRCWNAGCASGEEPYTVNIIWIREVAQRVPGVELSIIATDSSQHMLDRARLGRYPRSSLKDLPHNWLTACFERREDEYIIKPEYRRGIEWVQQDIRHEKPQGEFDVVFCRHLAFTYFDDELQQQVLRSIVTRLRPSGILVTGKKESLPDLPDVLDARHADIGVYRRY